MNKTNRSNRRHDNTVARTVSVPVISNVEDTEKFGEVGNVAGVYLLQEVNVWLRMKTTHVVRRRLVRSVHL